jgi:hypothetical protein
VEIKLAQTKTTMQQALKKFFIDDSDWLKDTSIIRMMT